MSATPGWYRWDGDTLVLEIRVRPRARREGAAGLHGGRLCIDLKAPPVDDRANQALLAWLSGEFRLPRQSLSLLRGAGARQKSIALKAPARLPEWFTALSAEH